MIVKIFFYNLTDYILQLQPVTPLVHQKAENLEIYGLSFIIEMKMTAKTMQRASLFARMLPLRSRRGGHLIKTTAKL